MNNYTDEHGMTHDRPCKDGKQSSGNPMIYTALRQKLLKDVDINKVKIFFNRCFNIKDNGDWEIKRYPDEESTKGSREEVIGALSMLKGDNYLINLLLEKNFRYNYQSQKNSIWKTIKGFIYISGEHRNFAQDKKVEYVYPVMFWMPWWDQYYALKMYDIKYSKFQYIMFQLYALNTLLKTNISSKNILWLQLKDLNSKFWIKFLDQEENFKTYFPEDHPINIHVRNIGLK